MSNPFEWFWRGHRITTVVTLTMAAVVFLAIAVITVLDVSRQRDIFEQQLEEKGLALSRTLNDVLANSLYFRNMEKLRHLAVVARAQPEIVSLTIFAPDGRILIGPDEAKFSTGSVGEDIVQLVSNSARTDIRFMEDYVEVLSPVVVSGDVIGGVRFHFDNSSLDSLIRTTIIQHIWQGGLVMLLGIGLSYLFAQSIVRPVRDMVRVTDRIAEGDFEISVEQSRHDEIGALARSLEKMTRRLQESERQRAEEQNVQLREANQRLQEEVSERRRAQRKSEKSSQNLEQALEELRHTQQKMVQQERLSAVGQMSSGIAHDINNRLQIILGLSDRLLLEPNFRLGSVDAKNKLSMIRESVQDASDVVNLLRDFYRPQKTFEKFEQVNLENVINAAVQLTEPRWKDQAQSMGIDLKVVTDIADLPIVDGSPGELREALINLLFNAVDALPAGGTITVRAFVDNDDVAIEVSDSGVGMSDEVRQRCLEPFFTTKGEGGSGLGLAMIYRSVQRHEGTIEIESSIGKGTTMRMRLPLRQAAVARAAIDDPVSAAGPLRILIVDDEPLVRKLIGALLKHDGHEVTTAEDGTLGLRRFRENRFDLVIVDRAMPGMNGDQLALHIKDIDPHVPVIMLTGFGGLMNAADEKPGGVDLTLGKPIRHADLSAAVAKLMQNRSRRTHADDDSAAVDGPGTA